VAALEKMEEIPVKEKKLLKIRALQQCVVQMRRTLFINCLHTTVFIIL
jgi:hypothetical protein